MTTIVEPTRSADGDDRDRRTNTAFEPIAVESNYAPPRSGIDPDITKSWLQRAMPIVKAHQGLFITALTFSLVGLVIQVQVPLLLQHAIINGLELQTVPIHVYVWWLSILAVVTLVAGYITRALLFKTAYAIEFDLRNIIYEHLSKMSFPFYDRVQTGQLISRANSDIRSVQMYLTFAPMIIVQCAVTPIAFIYMARIDLWLALIAMVTMPFVYFVGVEMRKSMFPISWIIQARLAEVATIVDENVNGVRVVKSFSAEGDQLKMLKSSADRVAWSYVKDADLRARFTPAVQNLPQLGISLVLGVGGFMVIHHQVNVTALLSFNYWMLMMQVPFMMLGMVVMMGQRAKASAERIYEILDEQPTIVDAPDAIDLNHIGGDVRFDNVTFAYGEDAPLILDGFDLHLRPGESVALVGRTGSGKSTVARLLARFYDVTGGSVQIDGNDVRSLTLASVRAGVGVVLDEAFLFSVSVRDNIAYGRPDADLDEVVAAATAAGAHDFIMELEEGYDSVVGERGYTLSGGQRQRIAIARTLLVNPPILVLDDATSAIDVNVEQRIHRALTGLLENRTTLIIAHRLSTISLSDRIVVLDGGRIVADGTHAELLESSPLYSEILAQAMTADDEVGPEIALAD